MSANINKEVKVNYKKELEGKETTSSKIRHLASLGLKQGEIYKILKEVGVTTKQGGEIRYQHVRNVLVTQLTSK